MPSSAPFPTRRRLPLRPSGRKTPRRAFAQNALPSFPLLRLRRLSLFFLRSPLSSNQNDLAVAVLFTYPQGMIRLIAANFCGDPQQGKLNGMVCRPSTRGEPAKLSVVPTLFPLPTDRAYRTRQYPLPHHPAFFSSQSLSLELAFRIFYQPLLNCC